MAKASTKKAKTKTATKKAAGTPKKKSAKAVAKSEKTKKVSKSKVSDDEDEYGDFGGEDDLKLDDFSSNLHGDDEDEDDDAYFAGDDF